MDFKRIEHLIRVAEYGSFSKAASVIGIAQPALGRQVRKLEEECGTPLLYRHGRGVQLTPDGEKLLERLSPLMRQIEAAVTELTSDQKSPSGLVTIGLTPTLCNLIGLKLVSEVKEQYPRIKLNVVTAYSGYVHEWLTDARVELAILHDARRSQHLAVEHLGDLRLAVISSPSALTPTIRRAKTIDLREVKDLSLVLPTKNHGLRRTVELAASQLGVSLTVQFEIDALGLMVEMVEAGLAHTVLAAAAVGAEVKRGTLVARVITNPDLVTRLMLAKASNRPMTRAVKAVESCVKAVLKEAAASGTLDI